MAVNYDIYTEVLFNGKWINIDSRVQRLDGKVSIVPIIWGKSWLWEAIQELTSHAYSISFDKLSDGTKSVLRVGEDTKNLSFESVDFQTAIKDRIKSSPSRRGYVHHSSIAMFQTGEVDNIEVSLTPADYTKVDKEEQREYSYYEWDDREGWYAIFQKIAHRVDFLVDSFNNCGVPFEMFDDLDSTEVKAKDIRLIIIRN